VTEVLLYHPSKPEWRKTKFVTSRSLAEQPMTRAEH
jgi:hypothetical protein